MNFLKIKNNKYKVNVQVQLKDIQNDSLLGNENNLKNFKVAFEDGIKYHSEKFITSAYPECVFNIQSEPLSITIKNTEALKKYTDIVHYINDNSYRIYNKIINSQYITSTSNLNSFIELFYAYIFHEIVDYQKQQDLKLIKIEQTTHNLKINTNLKELNFIDSLTANIFNGCFLENTIKKLNDNFGNESLIAIIIYEDNPYVSITSNDPKVILYLNELFGRLNQSSKNIYDIAIRDVHLNFFERKSILTEQFTKILDGIWAKEMMEKDLPINNPVTKKLKL
jgi:hypothetical protein